MRKLITLKSYLLISLPFILLLFIRFNIVHLIQKNYLANS